MAMNNARLYAPIEKTEVQDDGTIKVWGYASAPTEDSDGEIITADAMKAALPDYMKFGAVREMHGKSAAGTAIEAQVQDDGRTWFGAHVVDPVAVKKVQSKVYKGFSIGGRITGRDELVKTTITGLKLIEVSLVDRPANPDAVFTMYKAETELSAIDELKKMVTDGVTSPEQIVELVKASLATAEPDAAPADPAAAPVEKGMGNVAELAGMLRWISYMVADQQCETLREGDGSQIAGKLKAWLADGIVIFQEMTAEETAELLANIPTISTVDDVVIVEMADGATDVEKAGARNSKSDAQKLQAMHDMATALGAACPDPSGKAAANGDLAKAATAERDEAIAKAAGLAAEVETLTKRVKELEDQPVTAKAVLRAIEKFEDVVLTTAPQVEPVKKADGTVDETATLMKAALANPIRLS